MNARRNRETKNTAVEPDQIVVDPIEEEATAEPDEPGDLSPEAEAFLKAGQNCKRLLRAAAEAVELLGLEGTAKRLWNEAERVLKSGERKAKRAMREATKAKHDAEQAAKRSEREAKRAAMEKDRSEKKKQKIARLQRQLDELLAATGDAEGND